VARADGGLRGQAAPPHVEPESHDPVHRVVDRRDAVEHRADGVGGERHAALRVVPGTETRLMRSVHEWARTPAASGRPKGQARCLPFCIAPEAIVPSVPIEQGQMTYASTFADPDAYGAFQSFGSYTVTFGPTPSVKRASVSSRERRASPYSSVARTSIAAPDT